MCARATSALVPRAGLPRLSRCEAPKELARLKVSARAEVCGQHSDFAARRSGAKSESDWELQDGAAAAAGRICIWLSQAKFKSDQRKVPPAVLLVYKRAHRPFMQSGAQSQVFVGITVVVVADADLPAL